jgi:predicted negative regulator of RcsB-dependent stress response
MVFYNYYMEAQDTSGLFLFKLWPWIETNKNRIFIGAGIIVAAAFIFSFVAWERGQKEIAASAALTQLTVSVQPGTTASQLADMYLGVASDHPGTLAAQRAQLQGAATLFAAGQFAGAQAQFQKFLDAYPESSFAASAALGVAASLDAQDKSDLAATAYQLVINTYSDPANVMAAKFALARIDEQHGKLNEALNYYQDIARIGANTSLAMEAGIRTVEIKTKLASAKTSLVKP